MVLVSDVPTLFARSKNPIKDCFHSEVIELKYLKNHQPSYSDSYLMSMTKKQLIEQIRILEHNVNVVNEQSENQYRLLSRVSDDEIKKVIKERENENQN